MPDECFEPPQQIYSYLMENEEGFELLRYIDKCAFDLDISLETTISSTVTRIAKLARAAVGHTYVYNGSKFLLLSAVNDNAPLQIDPENLTLDVDNQGDWKLKVIPKEDYTTDQAKLFPSSQVIAYLPLFSSNDKCFGLILLESRESLETNLMLNNAGLHAFFSSVAQQLSDTIALHTHIEFVQLQYDLSVSLFQKALDPIACFDELARQVPKFLPSFGPLKIIPEVQILLYRPVEDVLQIVGSTGPELRVTRVSIDHSYLGQLIRNPGLSFLVSNPQDKPNYKDYLGGGIGKVIQHHLAVPIKWGENIIGVLNLGTELPDAFAEVHIQAMQNLCLPQGKSTIAPIVYALKESILLADAQQMSLVSALDKHLENVSRVLRHGVATSASTVGTNLELLEREIINTKSSNLLNYVKPAREEFVRLVDYITTYREDIRGFSRFTGRSIREIINRAIAMVSPRQLERKNIHIAFELKDDVFVYCSLLLTQHIYDLLNNAVTSIEERMTERPDVSGQIEITVEHEPEFPGWQENVLNKRCRVSIWDNGKGSSKAILARLGQPAFTTRQTYGGTGFGIFGAKRYIEAVHGVWLDPESVEGEFFKVMFLLDVYNPDIHGGTR